MCETIYSDNYIFHHNNNFTIKSNRKLFLWAVLLIACLESQSIPDCGTIYTWVEMVKYSLYNIFERLTAGVLQLFILFFLITIRCKATRMADNMLSSVPLIDSEGTVIGTAAWEKPATTNGCVLTLTSWILCLPGRNVDDFTFKQSCAAPACCFMLRTSLLV